MNKLYDVCNFPDMFLLVHAHMDILFLEISRVEKSMLTRMILSIKAKLLNGRTNELLKSVKNE